MKTVQVLFSINQEGCCDLLQSVRGGGTHNCQDTMKSDLWSSSSSPLFLPLHPVSEAPLCGCPPLPHCSSISLQQQANLFPPAWLLPPLLLRYLAPSPALQWQVLIRKLPRPLCRSSKIPPPPLPATFNLITGFLQLFRRGRSQEDNSRPSGFTNTLPGVVRFTGRGAFALLVRQVRERSVTLHKYLCQRVVLSPPSESFFTFNASPNSTVSNR